MKKIKGIGIFIIFGLSWLVLFWLTGSRTPWQVFSPNHPEGGIVVSLGDMEGRNYDRMGFEGGVVLYSKKLDGWLAGTTNGEIYALHLDGSEDWEHSIGSGGIRALALSKDGSILYVGEQSPEGVLYALDVSNGNVLWSFSGRSVIGAESAIKADPSPISISTDEKGNVYAVFYRFTLRKDRKRGYISRIISFTQDGRERWRYPKNENLDCWANGGDVSGYSGRFAFATANYEEGQNKHLTYDSTLYVIDTETGQLIHNETIPAAPLFGNTTIRSGPTYARDGRYLAAIASDGRGFLFDPDGHVLWERWVSKAQQVQNSWINAAGRRADVLPEGVAFTTINTFNRENWQMPSPVIHPSSNSLFLFTLDGTFKFRYTAPAEIEDTVYQSGTAAIAIGRNVRNHDYKAHGMVVVSLQDGSVLARYHTAGPVQAAAMSEDGRYVAGIEVPAVTPEGNLIGAYRLHIWDRERDR